MSWSVGGVCALSNGLTTNRGSVDAGCISLCGCGGSSGSVGIVVVCWSFEFGCC